MFGALVACAGSAPKTYPFDGVYFKAKAAAVNKTVTRSVFIVQVADASQSITGAREAGRYEGTRYCIENYGTSDIIWEIGPDNPELVLADDTLTLKGMCDA
ncbi:hypothetical protein JAO82_10090 [Pontibaca sp. S1109L]|uniref:Uncharacterized protein n=1 Tax=Pontibaca salina TaxID=2795731 RepID=A0A934HT38_9RHOB|nr:hypothetical protein [Pontibaca salina]